MLLGEWMDFTISLLRIFAERAHSISVKAAETGESDAQRIDRRRER
jgi:hypothetical protein